MRDPSPENIYGNKEKTCNFNHIINWSHVAAAVAVIAVAYVAHEMFQSSGGASGDGSTADSSADEGGGLV